MSQFQSENEKKNPSQESWFEQEEEDFGIEEGVSISDDLEDRVNYQLDEIVENQTKKKKSKRRAIFAIAACVGVVAVGVGLFGSRQSSYSYEDDNGVISGLPFSYEENDSFELDGVTYTFPLKVSDLTDNGWQIVFDDADEETSYIKKHENLYVSFYKDGKEFNAGIKSYSKATVPLSDGDVYSLAFSDTRTPSFKGPMGIEIGMSQSDVNDIVSESGYEYDYYSYQSSYSSSFTYYFNDTDSSDHYYSYDVAIYNEEVDSIDIYLSIYE